MNGNSGNDSSYRSLQLLEEISKDNTLSQRDLSKRLGIAVGLVNSYIKNMITKGYIRVSSFPKNRYRYLLTPKGIAEKSRLTYQHLHYFTNLYTSVRKDFQRLFHELQENGTEFMLFCGVDEVAEIAYLSLQETGGNLIGVIDMDNHGKRFFCHQVEPIESVTTFELDRIIITSLKRRDSLIEKLEGLGIDKKLICHIKEA